VWISIVTMFLSVFAGMQLLLAVCLQPYYKDMMTMTSITKMALQNSDLVVHQSSSLRTQSDPSFSDMLNKQVPEEKSSETQRNQVTDESHYPKDDTKHEVTNEDKKNINSNTKKLAEDNEPTTERERQSSQVLSENNTSLDNEHKRERLRNISLEDDVFDARQEALLIRHWEADLLPSVQGGGNGDSMVALANYQAAFSGQPGSDKEKSVALAADKARVLPNSMTEGYRLANSFTELSLSEASLSLSSQDSSMPLDNLILKNFDAMLARIEPQVNFQNILDKSSLTTGLEQMMARGSMESMSGISNQTMLGTAKSVNMPAAHYVLETPFQQTGWGDALNKRISMMVSGEVQRAELHLNPKELGPIEVKIKLSHDQASISFSAQHGVVREAIESALPRLREMLAESGLTLVGADVSQQQQRFQEASDDHNYVAEQAANDDGEDNNTTIIRGMDGLVDYFA